MDGITTAMVGFIFVCIIFPRLVKHTAQFYAAFGLIVLMMLLASLGLIFGSEKFTRFVLAVGGLMQVASLLLLVLSTGGLSIGELAGEFKGAFEGIRGGPGMGEGGVEGARGGPGDGKAGDRPADRGAAAAAQRG